MDTHPAQNNDFIIGMRVQKKTGKPFKSQLKVNTVKGFTVNQHTGKPSLTFLEDDSDVEAFRCCKAD